jgi:hypothetical protein
MKEVYNLKGKCNTLLCDGDGGHRQKKIYQDGRCRKLMPVEYERLQTLPDNYTAGVTDGHRYTAIGNGWTVDVIAHIFTFVKEPSAPTQHMPDKKIVTISAALTAADVAELKQFMKTRKFEYKVI